MKITYTRHAQFRMETRKISKDMVREALTAPDETDTGYKNRKIVYKNFTQGTIKVVYNMEKDNLVIISVMWQEQEGICS